MKTSFPSLHEEQGNGRKTKEQVKSQKAKGKRQKVKELLHLNFAFLLVALALFFPVLPWRLYT
jgi:hypothetical protein